MQVFLAKISRKERVGLCIAATFVFLVFLDKFILSPFSTKIQQINEEIKTDRNRLGLYLRNINQRDIIAQKYQKYAQYVKKVGSDEAEIAGILEEIEELAGKSGVHLINMKPQSARAKEFFKWYVVEVELEAEATSLLNFLYKINTSSQLLRVEKLRLNLKDKKLPVIRGLTVITKLVVS